MPTIPIRSNRPFLRSSSAICAEFRKENLRYVSNYWPIFDRGAFLAGLEGEPVMLTAPESKAVAEELCCWSDLRNVPDICSGYVEDTIDYPFANYYSFAQNTLQALIKFLF